MTYAEQKIKMKELLIERYGNVYIDPYSAAKNTYNNIEENGVPTFKTYLKWVGTYMKNKEKPKPCVYCIKKEDGEIIYIGKTKRGLETRKNEHEALTSSDSYNDLYYLPHTYEIIKEVETDLEAQLLEEEYIDKYKPRNNIEGVKKDYIYDIDFTDGERMKLVGEIFDEMGIEEGMKYILNIIDNEKGSIYNKEERVRNVMLMLDTRRNKGIKVDSSTIIGGALSLYIRVRMV